MLSMQLKTRGLNSFNCKISSMKFQKLNLEVIASFKFIKAINNIIYSFVQIAVEESPLMRQIRILENRLDKVMIKFNEAQSIRKTYEQIVKRLKEERVGYDNQLAAIERSLKGKEHDFEELLLLAHDATHAKELAAAELKKYEHKKVHFCINK